MNQLTAHKREYARNQADLYVAFKLGNIDTFGCVSFLTSKIAQYSFVGDALGGNRALIN